MKWIRPLVLIGTCGLLAASCGSAVNKNLDDARFALDNADYNSAITSAGAATAADPSNLNAFNLLSAGYSGQSGLNLLNLAQVLTDSGNSNTIFATLHTNLVTQIVHTGADYSAGLASLNTGITTLAIGSTTFTGAPTTYGGNIVGAFGTDLQNQYFFQMGILMYIQALGLPTITAQPSASGTITQGAITAANATTVQNDFINGYASLANPASGIATTNALLTTLSKNYCVLKAVYALGGGNTFLTALQDLTVCQLNTAYAGPFASPGVPTCAALNAPFTNGACDGTVAPAL